MTDAPPPPATTLWRALGEVVAILSSAPGYKFFTLADLEWMVVPAIAAKQFRVWHKGPRPIGVVLWARLDEESAAHMLDPRFRLRPDQWTSGDQIWITDMVHPGGTESELGNAMLRDVRAIVGPAAQIHVRPLELMAKMRPVSPEAAAP